MKNKPLSAGCHTTLVTKTTVSSETSVHITHTTRRHIPHPSQCEPHILHVMPRRRRKPEARTVPDPLHRKLSGSRACLDTVTNNTNTFMSQSRSPADQSEKFSDLFTVPFFTLHFNKVGSTCNLRLIFINGLGTPVSWVSDFQKAVLIDVTGLYRLRRSYCILKTDSLYFFWRQARNRKKKKKVIPTRGVASNTSSSLVPKTFHCIR